MKVIAFSGGGFKLVQHLAGAFGGALMGAAAPTSFLGGFGPFIGAGLGGLGFLS